MFFNTSKNLARKACCTCWHTVCRWHAKRKA